MRVQVAGAQDDRRDARADVSPSMRVACRAHVLDVRDRIQWARLERADDQPDVASPRPLVGSAIVVAPGCRRRQKRSIED